jgi:hypothetical protein
MLSPNLPHLQSPFSESSDARPHIRLNPQWRVIACRDGIQWIIQYRNRAETVSTVDWRGRAYCTTREALIGCCDRFCGSIDPDAASALRMLPERFPLAGAPRRTNQPNNERSAIRAAFLSALTRRVARNLAGRVVLPIGPVDVTELEKVLHAIERERRRRCS